MFLAPSYSHNTTLVLYRVCPKKSNTHSHLKTATDNSHSFRDKSLPFLQYNPLIKLISTVTLSFFMRREAPCTYLCTAVMCTQTHTSVSVLRDERGGRKSRPPI